MKIQDTQDRAYILRFDSIVNNRGTVCFIDCSRKQESQIGIAIEDSNFKYHVQQNFPSLIADLIDLGVAIHATDRLTCQNLRQEQTQIC